MTTPQRDTSAPHPHRRHIVVRPLAPADFEPIREMSRLIYPDMTPWADSQLRSHLSVFPEGQFVAHEEGSHELVGTCSGLIVKWDDYDLSATWGELTDHGMFTNHDPIHGRTLYAADVMVRPGMQGRGVGKRLYREGRFGLARRLGLLRIRASARLRGYHRFADSMSPEEYVVDVILGRHRDRTLTFQLGQGFRVVGVTPNSFGGDPKSLGCAAVIEWINQEVATPDDVIVSDPRFDRAHEEAAEARAAKRAAGHAHPHPAATPPAPVAPAAPPSPHARRRPPANGEGDQSHA